MGEHSLFCRETLNQIRRAHQPRPEETHPEVIERVPSPQEVTAFLTDLQIQSQAAPLSERLLFSPRDGTVAVQTVVPHDSSQPPQSFRQYINLLTVTEDYTFRCKDAFTTDIGWAQPTKLGTDEYPRDAPGEMSLVPFVVANFDALQIFLLTRPDFPAYLHQIRRDSLPVSGQLHPDEIYTVQIAYRFREEAEPDIGGVVLEDWWPGMSNYSRKRASKQEVTSWAVQNMVRTQPENDGPRLAIIKNAILAMHRLLNGVHETTYLPRGNMYQLLRCRHAEYMDGRARYPIIRSIVTDRAQVISSRPLPLMHDVRIEDGAVEIIKLPKDVSNIPTVMKVILADVAFGSLGFLYLLRLLDDPKPELDDVLGVAFGIFGAFLLPTLPFWIKLFTGFFLPSGIMTTRRPYSPGELRVLAHAEGATSHLRVHAVTAPGCQEYYNGDWLNFTGLQYSGQRDFREKGGRIFSVGELIRAGFRTAFALDGREVLLAPPPLGSVMRLQAFLDDRFDGDGRAVFEYTSLLPAPGVGTCPADNVAIEQCVLPWVRGDWDGDIDIGKETDLHAVTIG